MPTIPGKDWRELAEAAHKEQDPDKLIDLVRQLNRVLQDQALRKSCDHRGAVAA
jgi:hypothetical protein